MKKIWRKSQAELPGAHSPPTAVAVPPPAPASIAVVDAGWSVPARLVLARLVRARKARLGCSAGWPTPPRGLHLIQRESPVGSREELSYIRRATDYSSEIRSGVHATSPYHNDDKSSQAAKISGRHLTTDDSDNTDNNPFEIREISEIRGQKTFLGCGSAALGTRGI